LHEHGLGYGAFGEVFKEEILARHKVEMKSGNFHS
jgi:hypothetical protein